MTEFCDWVAVIFMFFALVLAVMEQPPTPHPAGRWSWACACISLLAYLIPIALAASHITTS